MPPKSTRRTRSAAATEVAVGEESEKSVVILSDDDTSPKKKTTKADQLEDEDGNVFDIKSLVKKASARFSELSSTSSEADTTTVSDSTSVAKTLDLGSSYAPVNPTARFFVPTSTGLVSIDRKAADVRGCESSSVYLSKSVITSTMNNPTEEVEKKADLIDALISSSSAIVPVKKAPKKDTAGKGWFDLPATPLTEELKMDFRLLRNRSALDPKAFYKNETGHKFPKYFQVGTVIQGATGFLNDRIAKKDRRETMVQEVLGDKQVKSYLKRRMSEVQAAAPKRRKFTNKKDMKNKGKSRR